MELKRNTLIISSAIIGVTLFSGCTSSVNENVVIPPKKNIIIEKKQPVKYVYNASDIEYVDIESMRKMKQATALLIDKVNGFEQKIMRDSNRLAIIETKQAGNDNTIKNLLKKKKEVDSEKSLVKNSQIKKKKAATSFIEEKMPNRKISVEEVTKRIKKEKELRDRISNAVSALKDRKENITVSDIIKQANITKFEAYSQQGFIDKLIKANEQNNLEKRLNDIEKRVNKNTQNVSTLKQSISKCCNKRVIQRESKTKYDKKIMDFLDKENLK